jgi:hypothetical protein
MNGLYEVTESLGAVGLKNGSKFVITGAEDKLRETSDVEWDALQNWTLVSYTPTGTQPPELSKKIQEELKINGAKHKVMLGIDETVPIHDPKELVVHVELAEQGGGGQTGGSARGQR